MINFKNWKLNVLLENTQGEISGPGVELLQKTVREMADRGAPVEDNLSGFGKQDWSTFQALASAGYVTSRSIPVRVASQMLKLLSHYKNTQINNYEEISNLIYQDINKDQPQRSTEEKEKVKVFDRQPLVYGKVKVYIPHGVDRSLTIAINKIVDSEFKSEGAQKETDKFGNNNYPRFKKFQQDKNSLHMYQIHARILPQIISLLRDKGYEIETESSKPLPFDQGQSRNQQRTGEEETNKLPVEIKDKPEEKKSEIQDKPALEQSLDVISFQNLGGNKMKIKINYSQLSQGKKQFLKEAIQYTFPSYEWIKDDYSYIVSGSYKQYATFGRLLKKFNYNVDNLRKVFGEKSSSGGLERTRYEGKHDEDEIFMSKIEEKLPESSFDLYDAQKKGVAFLYGRDHAILGDETGLGKTVQLVSAAALRMQETNRPTIIITLKPVVKQWISTITSVLGDDISGDISTDGLNPKKWTVLYYDNFSKGKNLDDIVKKLSNENFGIAILDELHKVKHGKATWSKNIAKVVANIPTRWGASATVSSNKPMDVKNQLKITGHHLGDVEEKKFKRDFAGENDNYDQSGRDSEEKKIAAAERLNRWLNLSGVYVRRSKSDVREMPNISVGHEKTQINQDQFDSKYKTKLSGYKNPNLPVSKLIAARETVAQLKTDDTTKKVIQTVTNGLKQDNPAASKVVVFTNFVESGNQLVYKISEALKNINPSFYVLTYMSDTKKKERTAVKGKFTDDANAKVLIMSMKMGGTGIDFPNAAQSMIINDFDWTPESAEQSEGRIYRINTNHPVDIKYVVSSGIDSKLFEKVQQKRKIANIIQQYRKDYQDSEHDQESLNKIVQKQKELKRIDDEMIDIINSELPGAGEAMKESFKDFIANDQMLREELLYGFSRGFSMPNISEWREKHVRDYKHVKQGFVAGNPRYSDKKIDSKNPKKSRNLAKKIDAKE